VARWPVETRETRHEAAPSVGDRPSSRQPQSGCRRSGRVLVVDDEAAVADMFRDIVTSLGYNSEIARQRPEPRARLPVNGARRRQSPRKLLWSRDVFDSSPLAGSMQR